jgi:hypothetical protein
MGWLYAVKRSRRMRSRRKHQLIFPVEQIFREQTTTFSHLHLHGGKKERG